MGALAQFGSLIWKNYVIRKRHPGFVLLEVLWPVLIFVVLAVMRSGFPPDHRETCEFQERALPTAGMIPFLQSSICQLENNCSSREWVEERTAAQSSFRALIDGVSPILEKPTTVEAFQALPKVNALLKVVQDFANKTDLDEIDDKLKLKNMFRDPDKVVDIIANRYQIMSEKMAEYLLESTVNPVAILERIGGIDFKDIVCTPAKLTKYLILYNKLNKYTVSTALCRIDDNLISDITNELMRQIDIANIIRLGQDMANITGAMDYAQLLRDIANLVDMYMDDSSLISMVTGSIDITSISRLPAALMSIADILPMLNDLNNVNFESFSQLIEIAMPFINDMIQIDDPELKDTLHSLLNTAKRFSSNLVNGYSWLDSMLDVLPGILRNDSDINIIVALWKFLELPAVEESGITETLALVDKLFKNMTSVEDPNEIIDTLNAYIPDIMRKTNLEYLVKTALNMSEIPYSDIFMMIKNVSSVGNTDQSVDFLIMEYVIGFLTQTGLLDSFGSAMQIPEIPYTDLINSYEMIMNASLSNDQMNLNSSLDSLEEMLRSMLGNDTTDMMMAMGNNLMDMMEEINVFYLHDLPSDLQEAVINSPTANVAINKLGEMGPDVTYNFLNNMVGTDNIYMLLNGETSTQDVCLAAAEASFLSSDGYNVVCSSEATQAIDLVFRDGRMDDLSAKMDNYKANMDKIMNGTIPTDVKVGNMNDMYYRTMDMVMMMTESNAQGEDDWKRLFQNNNMEINNTAYMSMVWWRELEHDYMMNTRWRSLLIHAMPTVMTTPALVKSDVWSSLESTVYMIDGALQSTVQAMWKLQALEEDGNKITNLAKYYPYLPYVLESAIGTNITKAAELSSSINDTKALFDMLCNDADWDNLNLTDVSVYDVKMYFCSLDMEMLASDLYAVVDPMGFIAEVERILNSNYDNGMDWVRFVRSIGYVVDAVYMRHNALDLMWVMMNIDMNMLNSYMDLGQKMVMDLASQNMIDSMTQTGGEDIETMLTNIDQALDTWPIWNRVRHYVTTWSLFAQAMNEYAHILDDGNFTIVEYVKDVSPTIGKYLENATVTTPGLIDSLERSLRNPQEMIERLVGADFENLCSEESSLSDLVGVEATPEFTRWQQGLCALNWTTILTEIEENNNLNVWTEFFTQFEMIQTYTTEMLPNITVNWTAVIEISEDFIENAQTTLFTSDMLNGNMFTFPGLGLDGVNTSGVNLLDALAATWNTDLQWSRFTNDINKLIDLLGSPGNDSIMYAVLYQATSQAYINHHALSFLVTHLDIINSTGVFDIRAHVHSAELDKMIALLEKSSDVTTVMLHNVRNMVEDNSKLFEVLSNLNMSAICMDPESLDWLEIPADVHITRTEVVEVFCSAVDFETLISEVITGTEGLQNLIDAFETMMSLNTTLDDLMVNYTKIVEVSDRYAMLIEDLTTREITIGTALDIEHEIQKIMDQFANFTVDLEKMANASQQQQSADMMGLDAETQRVLATMDLVLVFLNRRMDDFTGNVSTEDIFNNSTELNDLFEALEHLKASLDNQDMNVINETVDLEKMFELVMNLSKMMSLCENEALAQYISMEGKVSNITEALQELLCINPDMLQMLLDDQTQQAQFEEDLMRIWNGNDTGVQFDMESLNKNMELFVTNFITLVSSTRLSVDRSLENRWIYWSDAIEFLNSMATSPELYKMLGGSFSSTELSPLIDNITAILMPLVNELQSMSMEELSNDPAKLLSLMEKVFNIENMFDLLSQVFQPMKPTRETILREFTCDYERVTARFAYITEMTGDYNMVGWLCWEDFSTWDEDLIRYSFTQDDLEIIYRVFDEVVAERMRQYEDEKLMTDEIINEIKKGLEEAGLGNLSNITTDDLLQSNINQGYKNMMALFSAINSDKVMREVHQALLIVVKVHEHLDMLLEKLDGDEAIPITSVLPSFEALGQLLEGLSGGESGETLMVAFIYPREFVDLLLKDAWMDTACDMDKLNRTFVFPDEVDLPELQHKLCMEAMNNNTAYIEELLQAVDIEKLMSEVDKITSNSSAEFTRQSYDQMMSVIETLIERMTGLGDVNLSGTDSWLEGLWKSLENLNTMTPTSVVDSCSLALESVEGLQEYNDYVRYPLNVFYTFVKISDAVMSLQIDVYSTACEGGPKNLTDILRELTAMGLADEIQRLTDMMTADDPEQFTCARVEEMYSFGERLITTLMDSFNSSTNILECVGDIVSQAGELLDDASKLISTGNELVVLLQDKDMRNFIEAFVGSEDTQQLIDEMIDLYQQQEEAMKQWEAILQGNMTDTLSVIEDILKTGAESIVSVISAEFEGQLGNVTTEDVIDLLCGSGEVLNGDLLNISITELNETLCGDNAELSQELADSLLKYAQQLNDLQDLSSYDSNEFWQMIVQDVAALVVNIEGISALSELATSFQTINITNLLDDEDLLNTLQTLLVDNGPDAILQNLNKLLDNFKVLDNSNLTNSLLDDIRYLADGIFAFTSLRTKIIDDVKIRDLLKDPESFHAFMMKELGFDKEVADAIIDGSLSLEMLLNVAELEVSDWICDSTELAEMINFNNTEIDAEFVSEQFCSLDIDTVNRLLQELLLEVDVGDLVEELVNAEFGAVLDKANLTVEEVKVAVTALVDANDDLTEMTERFNSFAAANSEAFTNLAEAQTGSQEFGSMSSIICGTQIPTIDDEFNVGEGIDQESEELTDRQQAEYDSIEGAACKDMYMQIITSYNGPIIWAYLKPLLRGKILYAPDTPELAAIVEKANDTFAFLQNFTSIAKDWAAGSDVLDELAAGQASELQDMLDSELIKALIMEMGGVESSQLDDIVYTLQDTDTDLTKSISKVATLVADYVGCIEMDRFVAYATEAELEMEAARLARKNELLAGVVFDVSGGETRMKRAAGSLPHHIQYKIRMDIDNVPRTSRIKNQFWRPQPEDHFFDEMRYFRGFIQLQDMIDSAIISLYAEENYVDYLKPQVTTNQFPFPCHTLDPFVNVLAAYLLPVLMTASWIAGIAVAVYNLVYDRERGQEETLNIIGLRCGLNFWAWLLTSFVIMALVAVVDCIILKYANIFTQSNIIIVFLYFLDFIFSTLMLSYFVSAFFTRTSMAILTCLIVYFMSYLPFVVLYTLEVDMLFWQKTLACLSSTTAFSYAAQYIARYEEQLIGIQWDNVKSDPLYDDGFSFQWCCIMILIDAIIYFLLGWYIRNVKPGKFGVSEPWYFIFVPSRWCCAGSSKEEVYAPSNQDLFIERVQKTSPVVLSARGLSKTYSDGTHAVNGLNLDIHCGDVTTLLGHNGAAKTTTMNMLTGLLEPTQGSVSLLNRPLKSMRGSIGICSQHNALYEYMTVEEHMQFYSSIKNSFNGISAKDEIRQLLREVDLYHCRHQLVRNLSGGMQRRLSVALAFVGGSKAVILDEPTSGVDPSGRRAIWNLIIRRKSGTAVLLSTHHLDEADVISDQIAMLHEGRLLCQGSPLFLKHHLASGHRMTVISTAADPDPAPILSFITRWIPGAKLQKMTGSDMTFVLPGASGTDFYQFFNDFESQKHDLGVISYGISDPQLQEVFIKVCATADSGQQINPETVAEIDVDKDDQSSGNGQEWKHDFENDGSNGSRERLAKQTHETGCGLTMQLYGALLCKRFLHYMRNWRLLLSVIILPMLLFLLACGLYLVRPEETTAPSIVLTPAMYGPNSYVFKKQLSSMGLKVNGGDLVKTFESKPGIGTSCMGDTVMSGIGDQYQCREPDTYTDTMYSHPGCECVDNKYECSGDVLDEIIPEMNTTTTEILQNLDQLHINKYLLSSFEQFIEKRYGGWEFSDGEDSEGNTVLSAKVWFNNKGYHALPSFYNAYSNALLRTLMDLGGNQPHEYGITAYNHPFMFSKERLSTETMVYHAADIGIALIIMLAFTFIPVGALLYSVTEFINREKHMQFIAGISSFVYWMSSLIWDLIVLGVTVGLAVIILVIFKPASFWEQNNLEALVCLLALYGFSTITFAYCLSRRFRTAGAAFFTVFCLLNFIGIISILIIFTLNYVRASNPNMREAYRVCRYVFLIFPPYALGGGMLDLIDNQIRTIIYRRFNVDAYQDPFSFDMLGWNLVAMAIEGVVFLTIAIWLDVKKCCSNKPRGVLNDDHNEEDPDVLQEKARIDRGDCRNDAVIVRNLHKIYSKGKSEVHAVKDLSFGVPTNQCFGLLGVNGAGKTTTFQILTGVLKASDGFTSVLGRKILQGSRSCGRTIGYCPQEEALDGYLTVESTLYFNCKLKGIPSSRRKQEVERVMEKLQLRAIKGKTVRTCSGGMKRKLSLGIALLGEPPVVLLDEPTTGMDPKAKKLVWDCLLKCKQSGQAIILTSHSLEECDILCDRMGIMVNGEFKCLGTSQHLKQKFGNGYTVTLYVCGLSTSTTRIYELIQSHFPGASIRDQHCNVIQLDIPRESVNISDLFGVLEKEKANYNITYYTVSQTTLETIFLNFAREQTDGPHIEGSDTSSDTAGESDSHMGSSTATNPYYMHVNKPLALSDSGKNGSEKSPYIYPVIETFDDDDAESYSTNL